MGKSIFITEEQFKEIKDNINEKKVKLHCPIDPMKVNLIKKYLDKGFKRGCIAGIGDDGYPSSTSVVVMLGTDGEGIKNMTDVQLFYLLQDRFQNLYGDINKRDALLKQVIKDWFNKKITKDGLLSVNSI